MSNMVNKKSWEEFRETGLLWWINKTLHMFGWEIVFEYGDHVNLHSGDRVITNVYPARVKFRWFDEASTTEGYQKVTKYLKDNIEELEGETNE